MGSMMGAISDDIDDWKHLCKKHGLSINEDCYSTYSRYVRKADEAGFQGQTVQKYADSAMKADKLRAEAAALMKPFEDAAKALRACR